MNPAAPSPACSRRRRVRWLGFAAAFATAVLLGSHASPTFAAPPFQELALRAVGADQQVYVETQDGTVLAALNETRMVHPASVSKIPATLALLDRLGPDYRFATQVAVTGAVSGDALRGDLLVESTGDPFFLYESAFLIMVGLRQAGLRVIDGELRVSGPMMFNWEPDYAGARLRRALAGREGAAAWPVVAAGRPELAGLTPATAGVTFVRSDQPRGSALRHPVLTYRSPSLRAIVKALNCYSNNVFHPLSQTIGGPKVVERIARERIAPGLAGEVLIDNAAGAGLTNRMSARAAVALVRALEREAAEHSMTLSDLLPVAGIDHGTLQRRLHGPGISGAVVGKTGTYGSLKIASLAGVAHTARYGNVYFAILNQGLTVETARKRQDAFVVGLLAQAGPAIPTYAAPPNPISQASIEMPATQSGKTSTTSKP